MKKTNTFLICCTVLLCFMSSAYAQGRPSSYDARFVIQYPVNTSTIITTYRDNYYAIEELKRFFSTVDISMVDSISIVGSSSPEGDGNNNLRLATKRAESLRNLIYQTCPAVNLDMMYLSSKNDTWSDMLRFIRQDPNFPNKDHSLIVLAAEQNYETRIRLVKLLEYDDSYAYLRDNILPLLRNSTAFVISYKGDRPFVVYDTRKTFEERPGFIGQPTGRETRPNLSAGALAAPNTAPDLGGAAPSSAAPALGFGAPEDQARSNPFFIPVREKKPLFALKTNLLYDALTLVNLGVEVPIGNKFSVGLEVIFPWWLNEEKQNALQVFNANIEGKYWFNPKPRKRGLFPVMTGWFAGVYFGGGYYDLEYQRKGYQGESFISAGIVGGFAHSIGRGLRLEYSLGVGYMQTQYRQYEAKLMADNTWNLVRRNTSVFEWYGPTQVKISLVWLLNKSVVKKGGVR